MHCANATQSASAWQAVCTSVEQLDDFVSAQLLQVVSGLVGFVAQSVAEHAEPQFAGLQRQVTSAPMYVLAPVCCAVSQQVTQSS
jgi:hypothetical protein